MQEHLVHYQRGTIFSMKRGKIRQQRVIDKSKMQQLAIHTERINITTNVNGQTIFRYKFIDIFLQFQCHLSSRKKEMDDRSLFSRQLDKWLVRWLPYDS